jgi:hypothetical protein
VRPTAQSTQVHPSRWQVVAQNSLLVPPRRRSGKGLYYVQGRYGRQEVAIENGAVAPRVSQEPAVEVDGYAITILGSVTTLGWGAAL